MRMNIAVQGKIAALGNRPYLMTDEVLVTDAESDEFRSEKIRALCRCGGSTTSRFVTVPIQRSVLRQRRGRSKRREVLSLVICFK